ncbi:MAG: aKG-HExxH-type peptide beta-hydroxylase, partial [Ilumatobacteraceae bacterium]
RREAAAAGDPVAMLIQGWFRSIAAHPANAAVIQDPFVGIWSEAVLRGERSVDESGAATRLLGPHLDVVGTINFGVSTADGILHLPRCGGSLDLGADRAAMISVAAGRVEVESRQGTALLTEGAVTIDGAIAWRPTWQLRSEVGGLVLNVELGSDDPAVCAVGPSRPIHLAEQQRTAWTSVLKQAWALLAGHHRAAALVVAAATSVIVPQEAPEDTRHVSSSNSDAFGAIGVSFTEDLPTLAVALVHETRHNLLSAALTAVELLDDDGTARFYAGWRDDPRPVGALLQGACAFAAVTDFWRREHELTENARVRRRSALEATCWWSFTSDAVEQLRASNQLTPPGLSFVDGVQRLLGAEPTVERLVATAGSDLIAEHRTAWLAARAPAEPGDLAPFVTTTLADAWNQRLFDSPPRGHIDAVDLALTGNDPAAAAEIAAMALLERPDDPAGLFRFARALSRLGLIADSARIDRSIQARRVGPIVAELRRIKTADAAGFLVVAEAIDRAVVGGARLPALAAAATESV